MALNSTDFFLVQQGTDLKKCTLEQIDEYISNSIAAGDTIHFRGNIDLTQPYNAGAQLQVNPPVNGDMYINEGTGTIDVQADGWNMANGETTCEAGDRVIYDAGDQEWIIVKGDSGAGVETIQAQNGVEIAAGSTAENVIIQGVDAEIGTVGVVSLSDPAGVTVDGDYQPPTDKVLTEHHYNQLEAQLETIAGGGITNITGDDPITVSGTGNSREIGIKDADSVQKGVVTLTDAPTYNDTRDSDDSVAVTPAGLVANWVPKNWTNIPTV